MNFEWYMPVGVMYYVKLYFSCAYHWKYLQIVLPQTSASKQQTTDKVKIIKCLL